MSTHCRFSKRNCTLATLAALLLSLGGCVSYDSPDSGLRSDSRFAVPAYVRNLPKSRTGNMAQYTVFGKRYRVMDSAANYTERGVASWYGDKFHGRKTSSGEIYDMYAMTAAHKHLPLPTFVRVTNLENSKSIIVKVNDRGPFVGNRIIDLSFSAAKALDMAEQGVAQVRVDALSTHLTDENVTTAKLVSPEQSLSNESVAQTIEAAGRQADMPPQAVVEPEIAAVPLPSPVQKSLQNLNAADDPVAVSAVAALKVVPEPSNNEVVIDSTEDGFVEMTEFRATPGENIFIQLGAFSQAVNAYALVENVDEQMGLPAYVEQDATRSMFRVKMGPFNEGAQLENTLLELAGYGIEGYTLQAASR